MESPRFWRRKKDFYGTGTGQLVGEICENGHTLFPPRKGTSCPHCDDKKTPGQSFPLGEPHQTSEQKISGKENPLEQHQASSTTLKDLFVSLQNNTLP
jgi:hypothetical protein